jgi:molybdenum cofactor biosynthesis protein B
VPAHAHAAGVERPAGCAIVTVSDTRRAAEDASGAAIRKRLEAAGHRVVARAWVRDEVAAIRRAARAALRRAGVDAVIVTGGTGVAPRDVTPEAIEPLYEKALPGFGERFRAASERQVGGAAWLSRASAGIVAGRLVVVLPGSTRAVELALSRLLVPELSHVLRLIGRFPNQE